jgi:hypothetical protein
MFLLTNLSGQQTFSYYVNSLWFGNMIGSRLKHIPLCSDLIFGSAYTLKTVIKSLKIIFS